MNNTIKFAIRTALAGAVITASSGAMAVGAIPLATWGDDGNHLMNVGDSITATAGAISKNSYTDNPVLSNSAWGHAGRWYSFQTDNVADTTITVTADIIGNIAPAFTVWASGSSEFDGGTGDHTEFGDNTGGNAPHDFNATGQLGANGTNWMTARSVSTTSPNDPSITQGNLLETLGYANSGAEHIGTKIIQVINPETQQLEDMEVNVTDWGEQIHNGAHDISITDTYENGVTGSVAAGFAELELADLAAGWYVIFVGGADSSMSGGGFDVNVSTVSAVPVPAAVYLFGTALFGLAATGRRKQKHT